jgi:CO/xanthine dehydrogenase FAD-binding subunit
MAFAVHRPDSVDHVAAALAATVGSRIVAGGTLAVRAINEGQSFPPALVSLDRAHLSSVHIEAETVRIGAATPLAALAIHELDFLSEALRAIGSPTVRNMATVGGNLFAPQPYGDLGVCLLALDAKVTTVQLSVTRTLPLADFYLVDRAANEVVTQVSFARPAVGTWRYRKATRRGLNSAAIVAVAAVVQQRDGKVAEARIALGGAAPKPVRAYDAETQLIGKALDEASVAAAGQAAADAFACFSDAYASAWYRKRMLPVHIRRALLNT